MENAHFKKRSEAWPFLNLIAHKQGGSKQKDIGGPSGQSIATCIPTIRPAEKISNVQGPNSIEFFEPKKLTYLSELEKKTPDQVHADISELKLWS